MRLEIRNKRGEVKGIWVAKTSRGFNQKQLAEQKAVREAIDREEFYYSLGTKEGHLRTGGTEESWNNYQAALLEFMN